MTNLRWQRITTNADSPYPEDRKTTHICAEYELEITKEGDGNYWLRHQKKPLGFGPRLSEAKQAAQWFVEKTFESA